ncbi:MAG: glycosyltransferase family 1 protein [Acidimicrobiales bacterium]
MVATLHDLFPVLEPANLTSRGVRMMTRAFELMRRDATLVMCSSQQTLDDCVDAGFEPDRLRLVPLGATPVVVTAADRDRARRRHHIDRPYLLWVGTAEPRKNLPVLIQAFRQAAPPDHELLLVGPDGWGPEVASLFSTDDAIRHLGFVEAADLPVLYDGAEALLFPSRREGFGLPAVEAMAQGTPVVGAADTAVAEVVGATGRLLDPSDVDAWSDTVRCVASSSGDWKRQRSEEARARAGDFTWDRTAQLTVAVYAEAIEMGSR